MLEACTARSIDLAQPTRRVSEATATGNGIFGGGQATLAVCFTCDARTRLLTTRATPACVAAVCSCVARSQHVAFAKSPPAGRQSLLNMLYDLPDLPFGENEPDTDLLLDSWTGDMFEEYMDELQDLATDMAYEQTAGIASAGRSHIGRQLPRASASRRLHALYRQ